MAQEYRRGGQRVLFHPAHRTLGEQSEGVGSATGLAKILVVDDDIAIAKSLCIRLKSAGYTIDTANDGVSATQKAIQGKPDLIILDLSMPAGDGHSVLARLRENPETMLTPILVLTASQRPGLREEVLAAGATVFFEKPFESWDLLQTIERELGIGPK